MDHYFKPRRRKIGLVILAVTCVLTGLWVRSLQVSDQRVIQPKNRQRIDRLSSHQGLFSWEAIRWDSKDTIPILDDINGNLLVSYALTETMEVQRLTIITRLDSRNDRSPNDFCGLRFGVQLVPGTLRMRYLILPYWIIILPLTLLSTWLLLGTVKRPLPAP